MEVVYKVKVTTLDGVPMPIAEKAMDSLSEFVRTCLNAGVWGSDCYAIADITDGEGARLSMGGSCGTPGCNCEKPVVGFVNFQGEKSTALMRERGIVG